MVRYFVRISIILYVYFGGAEVIVLDDRQKN